MTELTTSQLIKILLGIFVVVVVVVGIFLFFRNTVIDFIKNLPGGEEIGDEGGDFGGAGASGSWEEEDDEEAKFDLKIECEDSDCTAKLPEDLKCYLNLVKAETKVKGYYHKCTNKGDCVRTIFRKEVQECDYGCTNGECRNYCLSSGTIVHFFYSERKPSRDWCCNGYYCSEKGWFGICLEEKCN